MTTLGWRGTQGAFVVTEFLALLGPYPALSDPILFDPPAFVEAWELPTNPAAPAEYTALTVAHDGSVWAANRTSMIHLQDGEVVGGFDLPNWAEHPRIERITELADGRLCLLDHATRHVWVLGVDGSICENWAVGSEVWVDGDTDPSGAVCLLRGHKIDILDLSGHLIRSWGFPEYPGALTVGPDGRLFVNQQDSDYWQRIHVWSPEGDSLAAWPVDAWSPRLYAGPSGTVHVLTGYYPSFRDHVAYSADGVQLVAWHWWGMPGQNEDGVWEPSEALAEDAAGRLLQVTHDTATDRQYPPRIEIYAPLHPGIIIQPDSADVSYTVDGVPYTGRQRFLWFAGSTHEVAAAASTPIAAGTRRDFVSWSDGGERVHTIVAAPSARGLRLSSQTLHFIETSVDSGGSVTASAWLPEGATATLGATPELGYRFVKWQPTSLTGWDGSVLDARWDLVVRQPVAWRAHFIRKGLALTISASETDPWQNRAAPTHGPRRLYFWAAYLDRGISALEADVVGSLTPPCFTPAEGVLNVATGPNLLCAIGGCPIGADAPKLLGYWTVMDDGGDLCLAPSAANRLLTLVDCPASMPSAFEDFRVVGFSSSGDPCDLRANAYRDMPIGREVVIAPPELAHAPSELRLLGSRGPRRGSLELELELPAPGNVRLRLIDVRGRLVRSLVDGELPGGAQLVSWDARDSSGRVVPAGVYFVRLEWQGRVRTEKLVYLGR